MKDMVGGGYEREGREFATINSDTAKDFLKLLIQFNLTCQDEENLQSYKCQLAYLAPLTLIIVRVKLFIKRGI